MMTLAQKVAAQYRDKAARCDLAAERHEHYGPSAFADQERREAAEWRERAARADLGDLSWPKL